MIKELKETNQNDELTLEDIPSEVVYYNLARYLSYQSTRNASLAAYFFRNVLSVHPIKKYCFKPKISTSHNTHPIKIIHKWTDNLTIQEVRINLFPYYQYYLVDQNNNKKELNFDIVSFLPDSMKNQITDFGIINEDLFWIIFAGSYCAVVNRRSSNIETSGFFDLEVLAMCTDMIAFDGTSTLYFSVKTSTDVSYLSWNVELNTLTIIHNLKDINGLPVIRNKRSGYFSVLEGGGVLNMSRTPFQRLIVTDKPYKSPILVSSFLSIQSRLKKIWDNFSRNLSTQYHLLSNNTLLLISPFGELVLHRLPTTSKEKWSKLLFTFGSQKETVPLVNIQRFSVSKDEKILAILYQEKLKYKIHIWDIESKQLLHILSVPSLSSGKNSAPYHIHFDNHNIVISDRSQNMSITYLYDQSRVDSTEGLTVNISPIS